MTDKLQSLVYKILIAIAVFLSPDAHANVAMMDVEVEVEEVCCVISDKLLQKRALPKISETAVFDPNIQHRKVTIQPTTYSKLPKENLQMRYCVFRE